MLASVNCPTATQQAVVDEIAAALREAAKWREDFCMDYRMKCDEQTKALHVEIEQLRAERDRAVAARLAEETLNAPPPA